MAELDEFENKHYLDLSLLLKKKLMSNLSLQSRKKKLMPDLSRELKKTNKKPRHLTSVIARQTWMNLKKKVIADPMPKMAQNHNKVLVSTRVALRVIQAVTLNGGIHAKDKNLHSSPITNPV